MSETDVAIMSTGFASINEITTLHVRYVCYVGTFWEKRRNVDCLESQGKSDGPTLASTDRVH